MPTITITITDTPNGHATVHSNFAPAVGSKCSLAQAAALDIYRYAIHCVSCHESAAQKTTKDVA